MILNPLKRVTAISLEDYCLIRQLFKSVISFFLKEDVTYQKMNKHFKIMVLNAQDLFIFIDKYRGENPLEMTEIQWQLSSSSLLMNKPKDKCELLALNILENDPDVVMLTEIGGMESLSNFTKIFLNDSYTPLTLPSNSDRGIDLGFLVKKDIPYTPELITHVHFKLPPPYYRFSRDVLGLKLLEDGKLKSVFLNVHIKSKLDLNRNDFQGRGRRIAEINALIDIYQNFSRQNIPVFIGGDFNGHAGADACEEEFRAIHETDLIDISAYADIAPEDRFSYVYFNKGGQRYPQVIEYLFVSQKYLHLIKKEECYFPRYKTKEGSLIPIPTRYEHKNFLPSDHYPFLVTLNDF